MLQGVRASAQMLWHLFRHVHSVVGEFANLRVVAGGVEAQKAEPRENPLPVEREVPTSFFSPEPDGAVKQPAR